MQSQIIGVVTGCFLFLTGCEAVLSKQANFSSKGPQSPIPYAAHCSQNSKLGHKPYPEYQGNKTTIIPGIQLHPQAAKAYIDMSQAANKDGMRLTIVSGFRSVEYQANLFETVRIARNQTIEERAKVSAPAGYSEHATGLAIDINSTESSFEQSKEYQWLLQHAKTFGFELSFPKDNPQGVDFEPWHWKYTGSEYASEITCKDPIELLRQN
jgi:LAS superfamily LD-carboxypeptidase LdcB